MEDEFVITEYLKALKRHGKGAGAIAVIIILLSLVYLALAPKVYETKSSVLATNVDQSSTLLSSALPRVDMQTQRQVMLSLPTLRSLKLEGDELDVQVIKDSNVLEITARSEDPAHAAELANAVAQGYINHTLSSRQENAEEVYGYVNEEIMSAKEELDGLNAQASIYDTQKYAFQKDATEYTELEKDAKAEREQLKKDLDRLSLQIIDKDPDSKEYKVIMNDTLTKQAAYEKALFLETQYGDLKDVANDNIRNITSDLSYKSLVQTIAAKEKTYQYLLSKGEELGISAQQKVGSIKQIMQAKRPDKPIRPNALLTVGIGIILGIVGGLGYVYARYQFSFRPQDIGPVLGRLSHTRSVKLLEHGEQAEQMRVMANLMPDAKLVSFVSAHRAEGKSIVAANLALALGHKGKKVLLIDANFRDPVQHKVFGISDKESGLSETLFDDPRLDAGIKIHKTKHDNLYLLPAGRVDVHSFKILSSDTMKQFCKKIRTSGFDHVLFDNSAGAESMSISAACDGTIFVVTDSTSQEAAQQAKSHLERAKAQIIGVVVMQR
jgi:tyrosine-protein kinase Etk/Wzc